MREESVSGEETRVLRRRVLNRGKNPRACFDTRLSRKESLDHRLLRTTNNRVQMGFA